jgi:hypothetical protein
MIFFLVKDKAASIPFYLHTSSPSGLLSPIPVAPALFVNPQGLQTARYFYIIILYVMGSLDRYGVAIHHGNIDCSGKMNRKKKGMDVDMSTYGHTNWRVPGFGKADGVAGTLILITSAARH